MPNPKLMGIVTALLIIGKVTGANAQGTGSQLQAIEAFLASRDCGALMNYLGENPGLLEGNGELASQLRIFAQDVNDGLIGCLSLPPGTVSPQQEAVSTY